MTRWLSTSPALLIILVLATVETRPDQDPPNNRLCNSYSGLPSEDGDKAGMIFIPDGSFSMGSDDERPEERFSHVVHVDGFWIDRTEVTNAQFAKFVEATGYVTLAERGLDPKTHPGIPENLLAPGSML